MVCWDENHRNGQEDQVPLLILRDRNHPSVVIWSICQFRRPPRAPKKPRPPKTNPNPNPTTLCTLTKEAIW